MTMIRSRLSGDGRATPIGAGEYAIFMRSISLRIMARSMAAWRRDGALDRREFRTAKGSDVGTVCYVFPAQDLP